MTKWVTCDICTKSFLYDPNHKIGIEVKRRGYRAVYYCDDCIKQNTLTKRRTQNEHI